MNSLKIPAILEAFENVKFKSFTRRGRRQLSWRSKKEIERANSKAEGQGDHVPQNPHPGK